MPPRDWDALAYERIAEPIVAMGRDVLMRLELRGDETVLDAGCGTGRVTEALVERLPRGRVIAVDGSPAMVEQARSRLPADRVEVRQSDLAELEIEDPLDAILSTATLHWLPDHDRVLARFHAALKPGGRLVAQCGGQGNIAEVVRAVGAVSVREPYATALGGWPGPWNFASPAETEARLLRAGFTDVWCWCTDVRVDVGDTSQFFATVMLGSHVDRLAPELRDTFVEAVLAELPDPTRVDYVRLNILARRARP
jgi:trans-aconitate 2-methyltransferase